MLEDTRALLSKLPVAIVLSTEPGVLRWASPRALELLGLPIDQLENRLLLDIVHPDDRRQAAARVGGLYAGTSAPPIPYRILRANGTLVEFDCESVLAEIDGEGYIITVLTNVREVGAAGATR